MASPLKQFLAVSIIGVTLTVAALLYLHVQLTEGYIHTHLDSHNENLAIVLRNSALQTGLEQELAADRDTLSAPMLAILGERLDRELQRIPVLKVKIYNRNGIVVYSTKADEIGEDATHNPGFLSALGGVPASSKVDPDHVNEFDRVVEIDNLHQQYIPMTMLDSEQPIGVFETYLDINDIVASVESMQRTMFWLMGGLLAAIYLALAATFLRTHRLLQEERYQHEAHLRALMEMRETLENRVAERTAELDHARHFLQATMDNVPDAILTCDAEFVIESANLSALELFNLEESQLAGRKLSEFFPDDGDGELLQLAATEHQQTVLKPEGGEVVPVDLWQGPLANGNGLNRHIVLIRDITGEVRAQRELEKTRKQYFHQEKMAAIGQLAAGILHEVGNPIAAIAGAAGEVQASLGRDDSDVDVAQNIELINRQILRLGKITSDIAEFASPKPRERELLDLNGLLRSTANLLTYDRRFDKMGVRLELDKNLPAIVGVADQLTQVFMNLLINSMDACVSKKSLEDCIVVSSAMDGDRVHVAVEDSGSGMSAETLEHVMETFFTTKPVGEGTGLGLSLCDTIVSAHGGELKIRSEQGKGTLVDVFLPVELPDDAALQELAPERRDHQ